MKTYLEVACGTGKDSDKLRQIVAELFTAIYGVNSVVEKIRAELDDAKVLAGKELNHLKVAAAAAAAEAEGSSTTTSQAPTARSSRLMATRQSPENAGSAAATSSIKGGSASYSIVALSPEEKLLAEQLRRTEDKVRRLDETDQQLRDVQRNISELRARLEHFVDRLKVKLGETAAEEVVLAKEDAEEEGEEENAEKESRVLFDCIDPTDEIGEERKGKEVGQSSERIATPDTNGNTQRK